jgi:hypothetical protein
MSASNNNEESDDDAWDCFGDDDESDDDDVDNDKSDDVNNQNENDKESQSEIRLRLIAKANNSNKQHQQQQQQQHDDNDDDDDDDDDDDSEIELPAIIEMWKHRPPLYMGPMAVIDSSTSTSTSTSTNKNENSENKESKETMHDFNRGYIATRNIKPGTLLLVEEPLFQWPEEQIGSELDLSSIEAIIDDADDSNGSNSNDNGGKTNDEIQKIVHDMECLYPTLSDVDKNVRMHTKNNNDNENAKIQIKDMIEIMQMQHANNKQLDQILAKVKEKNITRSASRSSSRYDNSNSNSNSNSNKDENETTKVLDEIDIMRMLLALRYNGFDSGLYLHFAMFNHCDDANCIKYLPESSNNDNDSSNSNNNNTNHNDPNGKKRRMYSEVRTTKYVKKGQALTLHYLNPREVSHATRRFHIWDQHRFDIGSDMSMCNVNMNVNVNLNDSKSNNNNLEEMEYVNGVFPISSKDKQDHERITYFIENAIHDLESLYKELDLASKLVIIYFIISETSTAAPAYSTTSTATRYRRR